jgi:serine/threonine protein phosphatase PrpC
VRSSSRLKRRDTRELPTRRSETGPGDRYLICSDGLSDYVSTDAITQALQLSHPQRCQKLIRLALQRGSQDNITCIVADVVAGLIQAGGDITDLSVRRPNLEDVFVKLTGEALRDED